MIAKFTQLEGGDVYICVFQVSEIRSSSDLKSSSIKMSDGTKISVTDLPEAAMNKFLHSMNSVLMGLE